MGRTPSFCPAIVTEVTVAEEVVVDEEIDTTPEAVGTAQTGSGITGTIWNYPGEAVWKYGVIFPQGYTIWNTPKQFRTYDDAEWYITDVVSPSRDVTPEEKKPPTLAGAMYKGLIEAEDGMKWWVYTASGHDTWYLFDPMGEKKNKIFSSYAAYKTFMFPEMMAAAAERAALDTTDYHTGALPVPTSTTTTTTPFTPSGERRGTAPQFMGMGMGIRSRLRERVF